MEFEFSNGYFVFKFEGFNSKQALLIQKVAESLQLDVQFETDTFESLKDEVKTEVQNEAIKQQLYRLAYFDTQSCANSHYWHPQEQMDAIGSINLEYFKAWLSRVFHSTFIEMLFHGNITQKVKKKKNTPLWIFFTFFRRPLLLLITLNLR